MMTVSEIKEIASLLNITIPVVVAIIVVIICIANVDKLLLLLSAIQSFFSFCSRSARKGAIANSIRGRVMKSSKSFRSLGNEVMVPDLKIDWVKEEQPESFLKNNQVIIRLKQDVDPHKNFVTAVNTFVGHALLPHAKKYIDSSILRISKLSVSRLIVLNGDVNAIDYFDENILSPVISDKDNKEIYDELKVIDKNGMFVNILLNEYGKAVQKVFPDEADPLLIAESSELLTYLYRIAMGSFSDVSELQFNREYFKIHIFLAARTETYKRSGIGPYLKHISSSISSGTETVYVFGLGSKIDIAKELSKNVGETEYRVAAIIPHYYRHKSNTDGRTIKGVCYEISIYTES